MRMFSATRTPPSPSPLGKSVVRALTATFTMSAFQRAWNLTIPNQRPGRRHEPTDIEGTTQFVGRATDAVGISLSKEKCKTFGILGHYGVGVGTGILFGRLRSAVPKRLRPASSAIAGATFGAGIFLLANEVVLPLLGVPNTGSQSPLGSRPYGLASHVVYGLMLGCLTSL